MSELLIIRLQKIDALNSLNLSFGLELKSSYSNELFLLLNDLFRKKFKKLTAKIYLIDCALPETEDHINSFQVDVPSPRHLKISGNL